MHDNAHATSHIVAVGRGCCGCGGAGRFAQLHRSADSIRCQWTDVQVL